MDEELKSKLAKVKKETGAKCEKCGKLLPQGTEAVKQNSRYRCIPCAEKAKKEWDEWCELYEYLKDKYFITDLPNELIMGLKDLRRLYNYKQMYICFQALEINLLVSYGKIGFSSDFQRARYLIASLTNNIDQMIRDQKKAESVEIVVNEVNEKLIMYKKKPNIIIDEEKVDYDFLD